METSECRAAVHIMGCSSGKLTSAGRLEASGTMLHYCIAGGLVVHTLPVRCCRLTVDLIYYCILSVVTYWCVVIYVIYVVEFVLSKSS